MTQLGHPGVAGASWDSWGILRQLGHPGAVGASWGRWSILGELGASWGSWSILIQLGHPEAAASYASMAGFFPDCCCGLRVSGATLWHNLLSFLSFPKSPTSYSLHLSPAGRREEANMHALK